MERSLRSACRPGLAFVIGGSSSFPGSEAEPQSQSSVTAPLHDDRRQAQAHLVDHHQARPGGQAPGDRQHLLLPAREHPGPPAEQRPLRRPLDPLTQDACAFYGDHAVFDDFTGVVSNWTRASASPTRSATARRRSWGTTACSRSARASTRRPGGSSRWSEAARCSSPPRPAAAFVIHSRVHAARPDVVSAAHAHSVHGKTWSSLPSSKPNFPNSRKAAASRCFRCLRSSSTLLNCGNACGERSDTVHSMGTRTCTGRSVGSAEPGRALSFSRRAGSS